jgi:hypothetical protein
VGSHASQSTCIKTLSQRVALNAKERPACSVDGVQSAKNSTGHMNMRRDATGKCVHGWQNSTLGSLGSDALASVLFLLEQHPIVWALQALWLAGGPRTVATLSTRLCVDVGGARGPSTKFLSRCMQCMQPRQQAIERSQLSSFACPEMTVGRACEQASVAFA